MTPGRFFTLLLYPPTHCVILRHVMIFINIGLLKFIIIAGTRPSTIASDEQMMNADSSGSRKRKHCECGFKLTGLSTYHQAEHKRSKWHPTISWFNQGRIEKEGMQLSITPVGYRNIYCY